MPDDPQGNYYDSKAWRRKADKQDHIRVGAPKRRYNPSSREDLLDSTARLSRQARPGSWP